MEHTGWSKRFARRAVDEYLCFLELAIQFGAQQSPSHIVDQAWHIHLQFTKDYWEYLCPTILGFNLHHVPTTKSKEASEQNYKQYVNTLDNYEQLFGSPDPHFWPRPSEGTEPLKAPQNENGARLPMLAVIASVVLLLSVGAADFKFLPRVSGKDFLTYYGIVLFVYNVLGGIILLLERKWRSNEKNSPMLIAIVLLGWIAIWTFGGLRIYHGVVNSYPVEYLIFEMLFGAFLVPLFATGLLTRLPLSSFGRSGRGFGTSCSSCSSCGSSCGGGCGGGCGGCGGD